MKLFNSTVVLGDQKGDSRLDPNSRCKGKRLAAALFGVWVQSTVPFLVPSFVFASNENASLSPEVIFVLKPELRTDSQHYYFEDVASCEGQNASEDFKSICDEVKAVNLGLTPDPGISVTLSAEKIIALLNMEFPLVSFKNKGASRIKVSTNGMELTDQMVSSRLETALQMTFAAREDIKIEVETFKLARALTVWRGDFGLDFPFLNKLADDNVRSLAEKLLGSRNFEVIYTPERDEARSLSFRALIKFNVKKFLPIAANDLAAGSIVGDKQFAMEWHNVDRAHASYVENLEDVRGLKLKYSLAAGLPLTLKNLVRQQIVTRGQTVQLKMQRGNLRLTAKAKTLASGALGQVIPVVYLPTKKQMQATVIDAQTVEAF